MGFIDKGVLASILFYYYHQTELKQAYGGRYLLFRGEMILGDFGSYAEAYQQGYERLQHPLFL